MAKSKEKKKEYIMAVKLREEPSFKQVMENIRKERKNGRKGNKKHGNVQRKAPH